VTTFRFGDFEWNEAKVRANLRKPAYRSARPPPVFFVVSAEAGERIRIITARKASPAQRKVYENGP
jgi:uncharacterized DUF497 family protein